MPHRIIWSWYTGRWSVSCYISYSQEGTGRGCSPPRPLLAVPNVTAHPSTASVPITVLLSNGPLLCGFNVPIKGLTPSNGLYCFKVNVINNLTTPPKNCGFCRNWQLPPRYKNVIFIVIIPSIWLQWILCQTVAGSCPYGHRWWRDCGTR